MKFLALPLALALLMPVAAHAEAVVAKPAVVAAPATAQVGQPAPDFTGTNSNGKTVKLSDYAGKTVVLEWTNPGCPFVIKHYDSNNMQSLQKAAVGDGVIWLTINSSAEDKEGYQTPAEANTYMKEKGSAPTARILDPKGISATFTEPRPPLTCMSSIRMANWPMPGLSTAMTASSLKPSWMPPIM